MYELTEADLIWNRACLSNATFLSRGDRALRAMVAFHSVAMNGGILHALELYDPGRLEDVELGYRYFGLEAVADFLKEAKSIAMTDEDQGLWEVKLDRRYGALVPDDATLVACFEATLRRNPSEFAPV